MSKKIYFEKIKRLEKLTKDEQEDLLFDLLSAFQIIKTVDDAALFVQDLLTHAEVKRLSKRLRIAKLLSEGYTYEAVEKQLHTSHATIAKIANWLADKGEGFRSVLRRLPKRENSPALTILSDEWDQIKRSYSRYLWPEILLEEIIKTASKKKKEKLGIVLSNLKIKSDLHKKLESLIHEHKYTTT
ncbi:hypothetical protein A3F00_02355 [Candidatus Daviesbacteria bacterium RIFCSPHIGHO2_12_FULL_37_11]|uniref:TrpR like protein, YerC/YecD n=1 Tax=Candidatus Daviesbacteria bacterium RIFCSPHIGHO2_12_FULL_37_11 TaxID=1797777 RepID=A0A1F5K8R4_9BACT|nr:MAG: hypothetical protein A2769_00200 [Candidatus Daviesbacteria bacterium RIFCSPHIGHO2_01_FULL_37_27]OGE37224.1 MAG: hypothetical protein A3F00_02355 [Candidatus Daviesbacteria bacterium RIFCSPHIGHO2_12_FULL_37_11]OGE46097.1 MAG: hypothetical protein A3B39_00810 [Candidatus Daviesbacteria bacterium RIFCSPLOWO2_01_FULL_37_10]